MSAPEIETGPPPRRRSRPQVRGPRYSRPTDQLFWMLVILVGVAGIGTRLEQQLIDIFLANRWLNGLIAAVFVVGVASAFWQAIRLAPAQRWAERFATGREGLSEPPQLLASMSALLSAGRSRGALPTAAARTVTDSVAERVSEGRDLTRYLAGLLIFLGLLGTFWGLARTVPALIDTIRALTPREDELAIDAFGRLTAGFEGQLGAMGTAFSSSLMGLAGSLIVGLLDLLAGQAQSRFLREFEEWVSSVTSVDDYRGGTDGARTEAVDAPAMVSDDGETRRLVEENARQIGVLAASLRSTAVQHRNSIRARVRSIESMVALIGRTGRSDPEVLRALEREVADLRAALGDDERGGPTRGG